MNSLNEIFGDRLRRARIMRNLSMDGLCEKIGKAVSKQAISKYEKGESLPGSHILILLSQALEVKPDYFFRESNFSISNIEFRKKAKLGIKQVDAIKEQIRDVVERYLDEISCVKELLLHKLCSTQKTACQTKRNEIKHFLHDSR
jgi:transcriptional regulator with XRE-family HTH domain